MSKEYGLDLKKNLSEAQKALITIENKINKRFDLVLSDYWQYIPQFDFKYIESVGVSDLTTERKLEIIINTEANYVASSGEQGELF